MLTERGVTSRTLGLGLAVLAGTVLVSGGPCFGKDTEPLGSTQRFRGVATGGEGQPVPMVKQKAKIASQAKITLEQAIKAATEKVPGAVIEAELVYKPQEAAVWELNVLSVEGKEVHLSVDAATGDLFELER